MSKATEPAPKNSIKNNEVSTQTDAQVARTQIPLDLGVEVEKDIGGVEMGVLENGVPYLTQAGLAAISGASRASIFELTKEWEERHNDPVISGKSRNDFFKQKLLGQGYNEPRLYIEIIKDGRSHYAYPDIVCSAVIEFYAFEAQRTNATALENFRKLASLGLETYIYRSLGYSKTDKWRYFTDRASLLQDSAPSGHFIVFKEINGLIVDLINADLPVNDKTVPDISVGIAWGKHWTDNLLDDQYGERVRFDHSYPSYYAQSASNPQPSWSYPDAALAHFRGWFKNIYLPTKFPKYILSKHNLFVGSRTEAKAIAEAFSSQKSLKKTA